MDRLANEGAECVRFYGNPLCSPTRASLMTGRYAYRTGILHTSRGGALMSADEVTAAELFSRAGYRTGIYGKWHLGDNYPMRPIDCGFQEAVWHKSGALDKHLINQTATSTRYFTDKMSLFNQRVIALMCSLTKR